MRKKSSLSTPFTFLLSAFCLHLLLAGCKSSKVMVNKMGLPIFLIPAGYQGPLSIVYGEKCGVKPGTENGRPVYRFTENGLLILQVREGYYNKVGSAYYFVDAEGHRQEITQVIDRSPSWTKDSNGNKVYEDRGNTTLEKYRRDQPVVLIKGVGVDYVKPAEIVNGEVTNSEEATYVYMHFGVYSNGAVNTAGLTENPSENKLIKSRVLACKEQVASNAKRTD